MPVMRGLGPRGFLTDEEKQNIPKVTWQLISRILGYLKPYKFQFLLVFIAIFLSSVVGIFPSVITGKIVDEALVGKDLALLIKLLICAFLSLTISQVIGVVETYINAWISSRIIFDMKNQMYRHLQFMPQSFFNTEKQGDIITRMNTDISGVSMVISNTLSNIVSNFITVVITLIVLFNMSWKLAIIGLIVIPFLILPTKSVGSKRYKLLTESQEKNDELNQVINETLSVSGAMLVKIFTREDKEYDNFKKVNEEVTKISMKEQRSGSWFRVVMGMFTQVGPLLIYFAGGLFIIKNIDSTLTVGTITATVTLINRLYRPVESLLSVGVDFTRSLALFSRIFDYLDRENNIISPENGKTPNIKNQDIKFENVAFSYEKDKPLLLNLNFVIPGGKMYAIVGPSGSGKSTIINFIPRFYDVDNGKVSISNVDVKEFDLTYLRKNIGIVSQETYLFNGTIKDNLLYAKSDATDDEMIEACKIASIHNFISKLPKGYDTEVGNRGLKLSGGEKQRISIARVILKNPEILILDEATSALDSISENAIQDALEKMMKDRTCIVIAHRLSTILKADKILVLKDGVIKEQGTHKELLEQNGVYKELYNTQFSKALEYEKEDEILNIKTLSTIYDAKKITESDISAVYRLCKSNGKYYRNLNIDYKNRNLTAVLSEIPEKTEDNEKVFVGFFDKETNKLVAILDLIIGYPKQDSIFIGWFMVDADLQNKGIGSSLFADIRASLSSQNFNNIIVSCIEENEAAKKFWIKQGFAYTNNIVNLVNGRRAQLLEKQL